MRLGLLIALGFSAVIGLLLYVARKQRTIMADLTNLTSQVAANTSVEASAVTLIQGLAAQIAAAGTDQTKLDALQASLKSSAAALAAAIVANTPASPAAPPAAS